MKRIGVILILLGIIITGVTILEIHLLPAYQKTIFAKNINIFRPRTNYRFNFVDKYGPEKEVVLNFKKTKLSGINYDKPKIFNGKLKVSIETVAGKILYSKIVENDNLSEIGSSIEDIDLVIAKYSRAFAKDYILTIDIIEGDIRYQNVEPTLIIRNPAIHGEAGFYFLFLLLIGVISFVIGSGIIIVSIIRK